MKKMIQNLFVPAVILALAVAGLGVAKSLRGAPTAQPAGVTAGGMLDKGDALGKQDRL